jgi:hypothetical protein
MTFDEIDTGDTASVCGVFHDQKAISGLFLPAPATDADWLDTSGHLGRVFAQPVQY